MFKKKVDKTMQDMLYYLQEQNKVLLQALLDCKNVRRVSDITYSEESEKDIKLDEYDEVYGQ